MGEVYRAQDSVLDRTVAVKVLDRRYATDDEIRRRFRREGQAGARLSGLPFTVTTYDVGEWRERPFIVMEYLGGGTLADVIREGPPSPEQALTWLEEAALSLDAAHGMGVVHRDVKPGNLLLDDRGKLHVADFGIATAIGLDSFTQTGTILGTAGYLSPEQADGKQATAASDRYALAVVAFELLTGTRPYAGSSVAAEVAGHAFGEIPSASARRRSVPVAADPVFRSGLEKRPERRYPRCAAFVAALRSAYAGSGLAAAAPVVPVSELPTLVASPATGPRRSRWAIVAVATAAAAVVIAGLVSGGGSGLPPPAHGEGARASRQVGPAALAARGERLVRAGRLSAAVPVLELALKRFGGSAGPAAASASLVLGQTLVALHRCPAAVTYLTRAVTLTPASSAASASLAAARVCAAPPPSPAPRPFPARHPRPHHGHPKHPNHGHHGRGSEGDD
jgi:serine/threonine-protein kinase